VGSGSSSDGGGRFDKVGVGDGLVGKGGDGGDGISGGSIGDGS